MTPKRKTERCKKSRRTDLNLQYEKKGDWRWRGRGEGEGERTEQPGPALLGGSTAVPLFKLGVIALKALRHTRAWKALVGTRYGSVKNTCAMTGHLVCLSKFDPNLAKEVTFAEIPR